MYHQYRFGLRWCNGDCVNPDYWDLDRKARVDLGNHSAIDENDSPLGSMYLLGISRFGEENYITLV